ncbi:hypothetical protein PO909_005732 [Leuciscus waleckii]
MVLQKAIAAAREGDLRALRELAETGCLNGAIADAQGAGLVHHAARCGQMDCLCFLVTEAGLPADTKALNGATPVHDAEGHLHVVEYLVRDCGADVHLRAQDGMTPLHAAAHMGHHALVCCRILLGHQISPKERDIDGFTAANLAEYNGHFECARYLRSVERNVRVISYFC